MVTKWNQDKKDDYVNVLNSDEVTVKLGCLTESLLDASTTKGVDDSIEQFTEILKKAESNHIREVNAGPRECKRGDMRVKLSGADWYDYYDKDCLDQCKVFKEYEKGTTIRGWMKIGL